jgi:hypothetical protein
MDDPSLQRGSVPEDGCVCRALYSNLHTVALGRCTELHLEALLRQNASATERSLGVCLK